jgi:hypothetical protein
MNAGWEAKSTCLKFVFIPVHSWFPYRATIMRILLLLIPLLCGAALSTPAQQSTKRLPPPGIAVPGEVRARLGAKLERLQRELAAIERAGISDHDMRWWPDLQIYEKAVRYALEHNEFFRTNEFAVADKTLDEGLRRASSFRKGEFPWRDTPGPTARAYRSRIDGSVQPFGLIIPAGYKPGNGKRYRLDIWLHGRDETLSELKFIQERSTKMGEFAPADAFVLHPYGRYCNAFKFAGEVDIFEALEVLQESYPIDPSRIALRGFSMGGAGVWHLATHYAHQWVVAAPGAGFSETQRYMRLKSESVPQYERALWQWYDATDYALNLFQCPTIAYSGELDKQRQAADVMEEALRAEGLPLVHLIGAKTEHKYHPETKRLLNTLVDALVANGKQTEPEEIRFTTRTLRYPKMHWLVLLGLEKHWTRADAWGRLTTNGVKLSLTNVTSFMLQFTPQTSARIRQVEVNGTTLKLDEFPRDGMLAITRTNGHWQLGGTLFARMSKGPGHQGPIDDAFLDSFVFVKPSGTGFHAETSQWIEKEFKRAAFEWRAQFRGEAPVVSDSEAAQRAENSNLVLWGDPQSNATLNKILPQLPIKWSGEKIEFAGKTYDARSHVPLMIFPNPLNPEKYVVLNSGFTFRGFGSNAGQTPKLPDYALLDISKDDPFLTGIVQAGFFNEQWQLESEVKK